MSITILGNAHRPCKQLCNITTPSLFFSWFVSYFFIWNYKICHIWQVSVFIPVTGFQCHSVPVNSGDCSSEITRISKFLGRSEILAGKFHWNGAGICRNDRNPAEICGASLRPPLQHHPQPGHWKVKCGMISALYSAPPIFVGLQSFQWNPVESSRMGPESSGFRQILEWNWNRTGISEQMHV